LRVAFFYILVLDFNYSQTNFNFLILHDRKECFSKIICFFIKPLLHFTMHFFICFKHSLLNQREVLLHRYLWMAVIYYLLFRLLLILNCVLSHFFYGSSNSLSMIWLREQHLKHLLIRSSSSPIATAPMLRAINFPDRFPKHFIFEKTILKIISA
jgi:hypothetical protein